MPKLKFTTILPIPLKKAFELGSTLSNLKKIQPGYVKILSDLGVHEKNRKFLLLFWQGLFPVLWLGKISSFQKDDHFTDIQLFGPFRSWSHTHLFKSKNTHTEMIDEINYEVWGGKLGNWVDKIYIQPLIKKMFEGRRKKTLEWLSHPAT